MRRWFLIGAVVVAAAAFAWATSDPGDEPTFSLVLTKRCLEERGRTARYWPGGAWTAYPTLEVRPHRRSGITESTVVSFAPTPEQGQAAEVPDSERIRRRGNALFPELLADGSPADVAVDECLDEARVDD